MEGGPRLRREFKPTPEWAWPGSREPISKFLTPNNFWTKRAICSTFGTKMEDGPRDKQRAVFASVWALFFISDCNSERTVKEEVDRFLQFFHTVSHFYSFTPHWKSLFGYNSAACCPIKMKFGVRIGNILSIYQYINSKDIAEKWPVIYGTRYMLVKAEKFPYMIANEGLIGVDVIVKRVVSAR